MPGMIIGAIPNKQDHVWDISSEKVPHMTMIYLGELTDAAVIQRIAEFVQHIANQTTRFGMSVKDRDTLGPDDADVLFFEDNFMSKSIKDARNNMLRQPDILAAYNSADQFPEWTPHLTLGYPTAPAKKDTRDYPISYVEFDRFALWTSEYEGPEFKLKEWDNDMAELAMSEYVDGLLHYGVKGMKWGRRTARPTEGPSEDHSTVAKIKTRSKESGTQALSNKDLQTAINRMNLEQQYARLTHEPSKLEKGQKFVKELLSVGKTINEVQNFANSPTGKQLKTQLKNG